ncbi:MAG: tetratricopeptide repeat protein [Phycisphaerae bacterium]|nr:tetratricopeptide repeat protein [Phycisphaerae bacterium]
MLLVRRDLNPSTQVLVAQTLEQLGHALYVQGRYEAAHDAWQECVALRQGISTEHWLTYRAGGLLRQSITALGRFEQAERLLPDSYTALLAQRDVIPQVGGGICLNDARDRLVVLYEAWGKSDAAARWKSTGESAGH